MKLILWKDIEGVETFVQVEVFIVTDEEKRGWNIVVDNWQLVWLVRWWSCIIY
jgi:hypothetical protein